MTVYRLSSKETPVSGTWEAWTSLWSGPAAYSSQQVLASGQSAVMYERGTISAYESLYMVSAVPWWELG